MDEYEKWKAEREAPRVLVDCGDYYHDYCGCGEAKAEELTARIAELEALRCSVGGCEKPDSKPHRVYWKGWRGNAWLVVCPFHACLLAPDWQRDSHESPSSHE